MQEFYHFLSLILSGFWILANCVAASDVSVPYFVFLFCDL
jgi:hypothetical protein